ncbi:MAG: hypothetical protein QGD92_15620, partial [Gammaproteobacteria bacterium]|nr:hypothetical protein [Gammaproteobacteria bacterium]
SGGMQVYAANVYLEVIKADTGQILAVASDSETPDSRYAPYVVDPHRTFDHLINAQCTTVRWL